ncbi:MAG: DNA-binding protein [Kofleriaceae bacterium]
MRILLVLALIGGCKRDPAPQDRTGDLPVPTRPAATAFAPTQTGPTAPTAPAPGDDLSGTIVATMNAGGYTYAQLDRGGTKLWVAGPETKLVVGTTLGKMVGQLMTDFRSNTLKRTFDQIYFVAAFPGATSAAPTAAAPAVATAQPAPAGADEKVSAAPNGKTVAAVWAGKATLKGKPVIVRGKVVKLNNGIMGKNWVHLRDGSGASGTNDLLVTTQDTAHLGDVVTASGTIATHQDFGAGYSYDVMIENATLVAK